MAIVARSRQIRKSTAASALVVLIASGTLYVTPATDLAAPILANPPVDPSAPFTAKIDGLLAVLTVDEKLSLVHGNGFDLINFVAIDPESVGQAGFLPGVPRLGIPPRRDADALGINVWADATAVPTRLGIAASFDRDAASSLGRLEGSEGRALGVDLLYGPQLDLDRLPDGTRNMTIANNPGWWMLHCHELHHAAGGMDILVEYQGVSRLASLGGPFGASPV